MTVGDRSLDGVSVVVTRAADQASPLVEALQAQGAQVVTLPLLQVVDEPGGLAALRSALREDAPPFDGVVVTSPNGARRLAEAHAGSVGSLPPVYVVGPGTAAAWEAAGGTAAAGIAADHVAEGVVHLMGAGTGRVLVAQGDLARPVVVDGLRAAGWEVTALVVYRTVTRRPPEGEVARARQADVITLASGSAARAWRQVCGPQPGPPVVAMGPVTAQAAREQGLTVVEVAQPHTLEGLVGATVRAAQALRRSSGGSYS